METRADRRAEWSRAPTPVLRAAADRLGLAVPPSADRETLLGALLDAWEAARAAEVPSQAARALERIRAARAARAAAAPPVAPPAPAAPRRLTRRASVQTVPGPIPWDESRWSSNAELLDRYARTGDPTAQEELRRRNVGRQLRAQYGRDYDRADVVHEWGVGDPPSVARIVLYPSSGVELGHALRALARGWGTRPGGPDSPFVSMEPAAVRSRLGELGVTVTQRGRTVVFEGPPGNGHHGLFWVDVGLSHGLFLIGVRR